MDAIKEIASLWTQGRVERLRSALKSEGVDGFIIPRWDHQQFEYVADCNERLAWATGFTGSWGLAIIMMDEARLFVDGRYTVQSKREVSSEVFSFSHLYEEPPVQWIARLENKGKVIGFDPDILSIDLYRNFKKAADEVGARLRPMETNPIDACWKDRPAAPSAGAIPYAARSGETYVSKRDKLTKHLAFQKADMMVVTQPDNLNWLFNIRGRDLPYAPVVLGRAILRKNGKADLFIDRKKLEPAEDFEFFKKNAGVSLHEPDAFYEIAERRLREASSVLVEGKSFLYGLALLAEKLDVSLIEQDDPLTALKAVKNETELASIRDVVKRDSAVWVHFLFWLEQNVEARDREGRPITEYEAEEYMEALRQMQRDYVAPSFRSISASDGNASLAHYAAPVSNSGVITANSIYLMDAGGQYSEGGTTDTTRTLCFSEPPYDIAKAYTLVLKGHIGLSAQRFPAGATGHQLDGFARQALWQHGMDYDHGTGHGVGHFLSVHEFPQRLQKAPTLAAFKEGMTITNEPGHYEADRYGIRIENLCEIVRREDGFLQLHELALIPIQKTMIVESLLNENEKSWLNEYHARVLKEIGPLISEQPIKAWLQEACAPI